MKKKWFMYTIFIETLFRNLKHYLGLVEIDRDISIVIRIEI